MGAAAVPLAAAGASALVGMDANKKQSRAASKARGTQKELIKRQTGLFDEILGIVRNADQGGFFDPEQRIQDMERDAARTNMVDQSNLAGAMRVLGYGPGDSEIGKRMDAVNSNYQRYVGEQRGRIRREAFSDRLSAYQAPNPQYLNAGITAAGNDQQNALARMQNPAGFFQSVMPILNDPKMMNGFNIRGSSKSYANNPNKRY